MNGSELTADQIFINVGARPAIPPIPGLDQVPYLTNSSMMDVDFVPSHLVILGGSLGTFGDQPAGTSSGTRILTGLPKSPPIKGVPTASPFS